MTQEHSFQQRHEVEPEQWAEWIDNAGDKQSLIASGQEWIMTDTVVPVTE